MSFSWLSIMGMYEYDPTIMDGLNVPDGIDKEDVVNNIMMECAELEIIYPRLETMKQAISIWSNSNQLTWNKLYKTMTVDYNPIWNVDADIKDTEKITGNKTSGRTIGTTGKDTRTLNLTDKETVDLTDAETVNLKDKETKDLTDIKSVQGFNSSSWAGAEKVDQTGTDTIDHTGTDTMKHTGTDTTTHTGTDTMNKSENVTDNVTDKDNSTREYTQRRTGNIGVTTTQQMLEQERAIAEFNMIEYITNSFKKRFCLMVY